MRCYVPILQRLTMIVDLPNFARSAVLSIFCPYRRQLRHGLTQIGLVDDVVAVEDRACLVSRQLHRGALGYASADQVSHGGASEVMWDAARASRRLARPDPALAK